MTPTLPTDGSTKLIQTNALSMIKGWQKKLNLTHWEFGISTTLPEDHHDMEIVMTPIRQHAAIRIHPRCYKYPKAKFEKLIIHEMLHPLFEPIQEEFERATSKSWSYKHFNKAVEVSVDHLANVLYSISN